MNCPHCKAYWLLPVSREFLTCPFCHGDLTSFQQDTLDFIQLRERMEALVQEHSKEIYLDEVLFKVALAEYFPEKRRLLKLFRRMIDLGGARRLYQLYQGQTPQGSMKQVELEREFFLMGVVKECNIPREIAEEGFFLLCAGLSTPEIVTKDTSKDSSSPRFSFKQTLSNGVLGKILEIPRSKERIEQDKKDFQIEDGVLKKYVGSEAYVTVPHGVTVIGKNAFRWNTSLIRVSLPDTVTVIGNFAFFDCRRLEEITLPPSLLIIGEEAFFDCNALTHIEFPPFLEEIGENSFHSCVELSEVVLPDSLVFLGEGAFYSCVSLEKVVLPSNLKSLYKWVFAACRKLNDVKIPSSVEEIDWNAFSHCSSLEEITIPSSVKFLRENAFMSCGALTKVHFESDDLFIGKGAFSYTPWKALQDNK